MTGFRNRSSPYAPGVGPAYQPGHWKADKPGGTVAVPEGPQEPREIPGGDALPGGRQRDPRTAENLQARADALAPKRWKPST